MKDLKLNDKGIVFKDGDWELVIGRDRVVQQVIIALRTLKNDWLLDYRKGINYFPALKSGNDALLKADTKQAVRDVVGVEKITRFDFRRKAQKISETISIQTDGENVTINEVSYGQ